MHFCHLFPFLRASNIPSTSSGLRLLSSFRGSSRTIWSRVLTRRNLRLSPQAYRWWRWKSFSDQRAPLKAHFQGAGEGELDQSHQTADRGSSGGVRVQLLARDYPVSPFDESFKWRADFMEQMKLIKAFSDVLYNIYGCQPTLSTILWCYIKIYHISLTD
jgi:hypothetical protein